MKISTCCYIEQDGKYLMLHRTKKQQDANEGKWIGVGGKLEQGESPLDCVVREVKEETGLTLNQVRLQGILTFILPKWEDELTFLYCADDFSGDLIDCDEGKLQWIEKENIFDLPLWEGDQVFLKKLLHGDAFFSMKLIYDVQDKLVQVVEE